MHLAARRVDCGSECNESKHLVQKWRGDMCFGIAVFNSGNELYLVRVASFSTLFGGYILHP